MCFKKIKHYAVNNPCSIYDEESMTALELAGRLAQTLNDIIDAVNAFESVTIPNAVKNKVNELVTSGLFDKVLEDYVSGGAYATQNKALYDYLAQLASKSFTLKAADFELGSWNDGDVPNNNVTNRARTVEAIHFPFDTVLNVSEGFRIGGYLCDSFGNSESTIAWTSDPYALPAKQKVKLIIARVTEDETETANVEAFAEQLTIKSALENSLAAINELVEGSLGTAFNLNASHFKRGSLQGWSTGNYVTSYPYRVATPDIITLPFKAVIKVAEGFKYSLCLFDGAVFKNETGWLTGEYVLPANKPFRMMIARVTENTAELADIATYAAAITLSNYNVVTLSEGNAPSLIDFGFKFGYLDKGIVKGSNSRLVTSDILCLSHGITLKYNANICIAVTTYTDADGNGYSDKGWVTASTDYTIPAGTYFRLMVRAMDYANDIAIDTKHVVDTDLYKSINIVHSQNESVDVFTPMEHAKRVVNNAVKSLQRKVAAPHTVKGINHRGYNITAPENTLPAYIESKRHGFDFVECDVRFTSDNVPVLLHDETINRTARDANGNELASSIEISSITLATALTYDFGAYCSDDYKGTKIATFEEFIGLCRALGLHPYIELEGTLTDAQARKLHDIVDAHGMRESVTWLSFTLENLQKVIAIDPAARIGYNLNTSSGLTDAQLTRLKMLRTEYNEVFANVDKPETCADTAKAHGFPLECWTVNTVESILTLPSYVSGITSDSLNAPDVFKSSYGITSDNSSPVVTHTVNYFYSNGAIGSVAVEANGVHTVREWSSFGITDNIDFIHWVDSDGNTYNAGDSITVTGDITLIANFTQVVVYNVNYFYSDRTIGSVTVEANEKHTVLDWSSFNITDNIEFLGWVDAGNNEYNAGDVLTVTGDITLIANFTQGSTTVTATVVNSGGDYPINTTITVDYGTTWSTWFGGSEHSTGLNKSTALSQGNYNSSDSDVVVCYLGGGTVGYLTYEDGTKVTCGELIQTRNYTAVYMGSIGATVPS